MSSLPGDSAKAPRILLLEDNARDAELMRLRLEDEAFDCELVVVRKREEYEAAIERGPWDLIISDFNLPNYDGLSALELKQRRLPQVPFVFLSGTLGEDVAVESLKRGATDYILKSDSVRLIAALRRALAEAAERNRGREADAALRASEERLRLVTRATNEIIWDWNIAAGTVWRGGAFEAVFGYKPGEVEAGREAWGRRLHPDDRERTKASIEQAVRGSATTWEGEYRYQRSDGSYVDIHDRGFILRDAAGKAWRMVGSMQDISARKAAERHIREQADIIDRASEAIVVFDLEGRITHWNSGAVQLYGVPASEAIGRTAVDLGLDFPLEQLGEARAALLATGDWRGEVRMMNRQKRDLIVDCHATLIRDDAGRPKARLTVGTDITERKAAAEQLLRVQRLESIGLLAAGIAHDLNNVLAPILMAAPLLRIRATHPGDIGILANVEKSAERGAALVRQILGFAHGVGGGEKQPVQIRHLLRDLAGLIQDTFPKKIRLETSLPTDIWTVTANSTQLHQVALNLCVNARDAMPEGGTLTLAASNCRLSDAEARTIPNGRAGAFLLLEVSDTGTGIPPDVMARMWEPFFTTKGEGKGTGLGLATTRTIVTDHGGFLDVDTRLGHGTTFRVYLPAAEAGVLMTSAQTPLGIPRASGELVLIIDDEEMIRDSVAAILGHYGYREMRARDGVEGLTLFAAHAHEIKLVVTDVNMPGIDGSTLCRLLRSISPGVKILATSGEPGNRAATAANVDGFLLKPFTGPQLLSAARERFHPSTAATGGTAAHR